MEEILALLDLPVLRSIDVLALHVHTYAHTNQLHKSFYAMSLAVNAQSCDRTATVNSFCRDQKVQ